MPQLWTPPSLFNLVYSGQLVCWCFNKALLVWLPGREREEGKDKGRGGGRDKRKCEGAKGGSRVKVESEKEMRRRGESL